MSKRQYIHQNNSSIGDPTWIIKRYKNVQRGLIGCSHVAVDYSGSDSFHCCNVILHAACGVDDKTKSFTGSFKETHHPGGRRWREINDKNELLHHNELKHTEELSYCKNGRSPAAPRMSSRSSLVAAIAMFAA